MGERTSDQAEGGGGKGARRTGRKTEAARAAFQGDDAEKGRKAEQENQTV